MRKFLIGLNSCFLGIFTGIFSAVNGWGFNSVQFWILLLGGIVIQSNLIIIHNVKFDDSTE